MSPAAPQPVAPLSELCSVLIRYRWRWLLPAVLIAAGTSYYAVNKSNKYEVSQALMIRNETAPQGDSPGRFLFVDEMKTLQETLLEVAASRPVLESALKTVGPPQDTKVVGQWPSDEAIRDLRAAMSLKPPKGSEFGKTEVFYLKVQDQDPQRALLLVNAAFDRVRDSFGEVRNARAGSLISELSETVSLCQNDLKCVTDQCTDIEKSVGSDLGELRSLNQSAQGGGELQRSAASLQTKLYDLRETQTVQSGFLELLQAARKDPRVLTAAPNTLIQSQSPLVKLRDGLVAAQLRTANLKGRLSEEYPSVKAAIREEEVVRASIFSELDVMIGALTADMETNRKREEVLTGQHKELCERIANLGAIRATYSNVHEQVAHRRKLLEAAERELGEARAIQAAAHTSSLIWRIDLPETGTTPIGPGQTSIVLMGIGGGLVAGLGILLLTVPRMTQESPPETAGAYRNGRHTARIASNGSAHENGNGNGSGHAAAESREPLRLPPRLETVGS